MHRASTIEMANSGSIPGRVISTHASTLLVDRVEGGLEDRNVPTLSNGQGNLENKL